MPGPHPPDAMPPLPPPLKFSVARSRTRAAQRRANQRLARATNTQFGDVINPPLSGDNLRACDVATLVAGNLATDFEPGDTVDGVTLVQNMRILIKNQASGVENGIYFVLASGQPQRAQDLPPGSQAAGVFLFVLGGTQAGEVWRCTNAKGSDIVGTDALTWAKYSPSGGGGGTPTFHGTKIVQPAGGALAPGLDNTISWNATPVWDIDSMYNGSNILTVATTGYYLATFLLTFTPSASNADVNFQAKVNVNGVAAFTLQNEFDLLIGTPNCLNGSVVLVLASGDTLSLIERHSVNSMTLDASDFFELTLLGV